MSFNEVLEKFETMDPNELLESLKKLEQISIDAAAEARQACSDYYSDAQEKEELVKSKLADLTKQYDTFQSKINVMKKPLIMATIEGNDKKLTALRADMTNLEAQKAQMSTELEMLQNAIITGGEELYNAAVEKESTFKSLHDEYRKFKRMLYAFADEQEQAYKEICRATSKNHNGDEYGGGTVPNMDKLERHFHAERYAEAAKCAKERESRETTEINAPRITGQWHTNYSPSDNPKPVYMVENGPSVEIHDGRKGSVHSFSRGPRMDY